MCFFVCFGAREEEILLCYGGWETAFLRLPPEARRKHLFDHWGFHCHCERCEAELSRQASVPAESRSG